MKATSLDLSSALWLLVLVLAALLIYVRTKLDKATAEATIARAAELHLREALENTRDTMRKVVSEVHTKPGEFALQDGVLSEENRLEARFRLVVEATPNAVVVTNQSGTIELVNTQTELLFGYSRDELLGKPVEMLVPQRLRIHHPSYRADYLKAPQTRPMGTGRDLFGLRRDGSEFPVEIGLNPISTDQGMLILSSIIDITSRKTAENKLKEQAQEIAKASRYKSDFLATMSHELRTPLNSILILSEQLRNNKSGNLTSKQCEHADIIYRSGRDLLHLINDILDLSKIEAGQITVAPEQFLIADLIDSVKQTFTPLADAKHLVFEVDIAADTPASIESDFQRLFQILKNLVANAIKFTDQGSVAVRVNPASYAGENAKPGLLICVTDTGPGIPFDKQELVFQAFRQVDGSTSRQFGGTGLGLTISRRLANALGGDIRLKSEPGQGCEFTLRIPLKSLPQTVYAQELAQTGAIPSPHTSSDQGHRSQTRPKTILVVDDDVRNIYASSSVLEEHGFEVMSALNGIEAMAVLDRGEKVDLILMDIIMPIMEGIELLYLLRQRDVGVPVIALTACAMKGDREKYLAAGADDYLSKPVANEDLINTIHYWLDHVQEQVKP